MTLNAYKCQSAVRIYTAGQRCYNNAGNEFISRAPALCSDVNNTCKTVSRVAAIHMLRSIQAVRKVAAPAQVITRKYTIRSSINVYRRFGVTKPRSVSSTRIIRRPCQLRALTAIEMLSSLYNGP